MNFFDQPPSEKWAALTFRGERIAEVWFKPGGEPLALAFRVPRASFEVPGVGQRLTAEALLKAVAVPADEVESWRCEGAAEGPGPELTAPLPPPPADAAHLEVHVRLKPPRAAASEPDGEREAGTSAEWQALELLWKTVQGLEATVDVLRMSVEGLRAQLESAIRQTLTADEKVHALAADTAQWDKAKSRARYTLPKAAEFIHRATWAAGTPERKRLGELFKAPIETQSDLPPADEVLQALENLRKDRQVLSAHGQAVSQECKSVLTDVQGTLRSLQRNAASRASQKKGGTGAKGKSF